MGQAKQRQSRHLARFRELGAQFAELGIDTSMPGFYDHPNFLAVERGDQRFLETYAEWVRLRPRSAAEDQRTRDVVPRAAELVCGWIEDAGRRGLCVDATNMLTRCLDRLGIWNYGVAGGFNVGLKQDPQAGRRYFWVVDELGEGAGQLGHVWVVAPPFDLVDVTIRAQGWEPSFLEAMPRFLCIENARRATMNADDIVAAEIRAAYRSRQISTEDLHLRFRPHLGEMERRFPGLAVDTTQIDARYLPTGIRACEQPLEQMHRLEGRRFWNEQVVPAFGLEPIP